MRIAIIITARPSYAKAKTVIAALVARGVDVQIIACASAMLERYGRVVEVIRKDFPDVPITEVWSTYEGANLITSAKETGALCIETAGVVCRLRPDCVVLIADRHEVLGAAQAISYAHIPLVHLQGGEHSGSIDDKVRDSITQLADVHCVCTEQARFRVYALTGEWNAIHVTGCPSIDLAKQVQDDPPVTIQELGGAGTPVDLDRPFVVVLQHPVTNEMAQAGEQIAITLDGLGDVPAVVFWPGEDAGADAMSKVIRMHPNVHTVRNLSPARFLRLLTQCGCLVGNSSAGIRECSYLGVPVVNIGSRQQGRERARNVMDVLHKAERIWEAVMNQIQHGPYLSSGLYGRGDAGERIAEALIGIRTSEGVRPRVVLRADGEPRETGSAVRV